VESAPIVAKWYSRHSLPKTADVFNDRQEFHVRHRNLRLESDRTFAKSGLGCDKLAQAIDGITDSTVEVKRLVDEVSVSSGEQARGIDHIARALSEIERITQQAAASAQQSASASTAMSTQSEAMDAVTQQLVAMVGESS
jgi:methyl-accepting chemotaxis protein